MSLKKLIFKKYIYILEKEEGNVVKMSILNKRGRTRGQSLYSKALDPKANALKASAERRLRTIEAELKNIEKYKTPVEKSKGPRQMIIDFINDKEENVSDEDIIEFMQKIMKNADRDYVQNLIDQIRVPIIIAYYKYRSGIASKAIEDIVNKYPDISRMKVAKVIQKYRINPNFLIKSEKAQVDEALRKIIDEANKGNNRADAGEDR